METRNTATSPTVRRTPPIDVFEDEQALCVSAELPGVAPGEVELTVEQGVLSLRARTAASLEGAATEYVRRLSLRDPARYDTEQVSAVLRHGLLEVRLPKAAHARRRQIPVA